MIIASNKETITGRLWFFHYLLLLYINVACITKTFYKWTIWVKILLWNFGLLRLYSFISFSERRCDYFILYFVHYIAIHFYHPDWWVIRTIDIPQKTTWDTILLCNFILIENKLRIRSHSCILKLDIYLWLHKCTIFLWYALGLFSLVFYLKFLPLCHSWDILDSL